MSSVNTLTGRKGKFQVGTVLVARTKKWGVNPKMASSSEWGDSDSNGFTNRAPGRRDATFNADGVYQTDDEVFDIFEPGDIVKAVLWMNNTTLYWAFPRALCSEFSMEVNIETEEVIGWSSGWGADGRFWHPGETAESGETDTPPTETLPT